MPSLQRAGGGAATSATGGLQDSVRQGRLATLRRAAPAKRNPALVTALNEMAESFGDSFAVVEVTADDGETQIWIAVAKPSQAVTLVLVAAPEGSTA
ncbi:hypothetical protein [Bradyrhizobium barranii]